MKISPFEVGKMISKAIKNKDRYKARVEELRSNPLQVTVGNATAIYDIDINRISQIKVDGVGEDEIENIRQAVNEVFDKADHVWSEFDS